MSTMYTKDLQLTKINRFILLKKFFYELNNKGTTIKNGKVNPSLEQ